MCSMVKATMRQPTDIVLVASQSSYIYDLFIDVKTNLTSPDQKPFSFCVMLDLMICPCSVCDVTLALTVTCTCACPRFAMRAT